MKKLRSKFLVFILIPVFIVVILAGVASYLVARTIVLDQLWNIGINVLQQAADELDATFGTGVQTLRILGIDEGFHNRTDADITQLFQELKKRLPVEAIFIIFLDNRFISSYGNDIPEGFDPLFEPWFTDALDSNEPVISGPLESPFNGRQIVIIANKVLDRTGKPIGVIGYSVSLESIRYRIPRIASLEEQGNYNLSVFLRDGTYLINSNPSLIGKRLGQSNSDLHIMMRQALSEEKPNWKGTGDIQGEGYFGGFEKSRYGELYVGLEIPLSVGMRPIIVLASSYLGLGFICIVILSIMLTLLAGRIAKPINMLSQAAEKFRKGETTEDLPVITKDELGHLIETFNAMTHDIKQKNFIRDTFGRYVTPEIANQVLGKEDGLLLGGEHRYISLLMSDLRGFSAQTARMQPEKVIALLNRYLGTMVEIIISHSGVVDEMQGDGILAFFGAPVQFEDHSAKAVACAIDMQNAMSEINRLNREDGLPELEMGIGINTGDVIVGNIGSEKRTKYGVVGPAINLTGRIESYTLGGQILVSPETYENTKDILQVKNVLSVQMKGFKGNVTLYNILGIGGTHQRVLKEIQNNKLIKETNLPVAIRKITNKVVSDEAIIGEIKELTESSALIKSTTMMDIGTDVRLDPINLDLVSKEVEALGKIITLKSTGGTYLFTVRFTFLSPTAIKILQNLLSEVAK